MIILEQCFEAVVVLNFNIRKRVLERLQSESSIYSFRHSAEMQTEIKLDKNDEQLSNKLHAKNYKSHHSSPLNVAQNFHAIHSALVLFQV